MTQQDIQQWALSRETSLEVARAIHEYVNDYRPAQAIWEAPTDFEIAAVRARAFEHSDDNSLQWGAWKLWR